MARYVECDRCKKRIPQEDRVYDARIPSQSIANTARSYDVCEQCLCDIERFVQEQPATQRNS
jgi:hypothetical protein